MSVSRKLVGGAFLAVCVALYAWVLFIPQRATDIGFGIDDPSYLFGCYAAGDAEIRLYRDHADFGGDLVPISYGMRKSLGEVIYPERFPWFDAETGQFRFRSDRFDLLNLEQDAEGIWRLRIWQSRYLDTSRTDDLVETTFEKGGCA
jgi:hypothetical protein